MIRWKIRYRLSAARCDHGAGQLIVGGLRQDETGCAEGEKAWNKIEKK